MEVSCRKWFLMSLLLSLLMVFPLAFGQDAADMVGVKVGDYVEYEVTKQGTPAVWGTLPVEEAVEVKVEVLNVSGNVIWIDLTYHLPDGSQEKETDKIRDLQDTTGYILPANVSAGDEIAEWGALSEELIFLNATVWRSYSGTTRKVNILEISEITSMLGHPLNISQELCWDRQTGFLLEKTVKMYPLDVENASLFIWMWEISGTNLWKMESQETSQPWLLAIAGLTVTTAICATVIILKLQNKKK